ncbi:MAG: serine kinase [Candidatus Levybacteria bacterium]|nr:serine kinase [Candidatus Levybacteria bacterium]
MQLHHTFLNDLRETFNKATLNSGVIERYFKIGPCEVHMRFASPELVNKMTPALEHLEIAKSQNPDLTIFLWDDKTTHSVMQPFPWVDLPSRKQSSITKLLNTDEIYTTYNAFKRILNVYDASSQTAFFWVPDARKVPFDELTSPLQNILHKFLMLKGAYLVHAGAVGTPRGGILLAGKGGSGKSTSVLSCLNSELFYAADNCTLLTGGSNPTAYSLYSSARLHGQTLWRVPHLIPSVVNRSDLKREKAVMFLNQMWREKLISQFPLRAIFLPHVTSSLNTTIVPAKTKDAIHALILSTVVQLPQTDPHMVQELIKIIHSVPAYHLELGTEMSQIPQVILKFLKES